MADNLSQEKWQEAQQLPSEKSRLDRVIDVVAAIFVPIINLLCAAGILKGLLVIGVSLGAVSQDSTTYLIANAMADSLFYFLPMFLAYTAAKRFGGNPFTCVIIAGILLYPGLTEVLAAGDTISFLGIPIKGAVYHSSVLPILLAAYFLAVLERAVSSRLPDVLKGFLTPLICIFVGGTVTLFAFGPIGAFVGEWLAVGYEAIYVVSPILTGLVIGAIFQPMVIFGLHWALMIISMNNVAVLGSDTILALFAASIFAQGGAGAVRRDASPQETAPCRLCGRRCRRHGCRLLRRTGERVCNSVRHHLSHLFWQRIRVDDRLRSRRFRRELCAHNAAEIRGNAGGDRAGGFKEIADTVNV